MVGFRVRVWVVGVLLVGPCADQRWVVPAAAGVDGEVRLELDRVEPSGGGRSLRVGVVQEVRGGPPQGLGHVQFSTDGFVWRDLGPPFPWTRQGHEFPLEVRLPGWGSCFVRLAVFETGRELPFLQSNHLWVRGVRGRESGLDGEEAGRS